MIRRKTIATKRKNQFPYPTWVEAGFSLVLSFLRKKKERRLFREKPLPNPPEKRIGVGQAAMIRRKTIATKRKKPVFIPNLGKSWFFFGSFFFTKKERTAAFRGKAPPKPTRKAHWGGTGRYDPPENHSRKNQFPYPTWVEAGFSLVLSFLLKKKEQSFFFCYFSFSLKKKSRTRYFFQKVHSITGL